MRTPEAYGKLPRAAPCPPCAGSGLWYHPSKSKLDDVRRARNTRSKKEECSMFHRFRAWGGLFFVSLASIAFEIFLTRFFALSNWSEYGYWVISMAMAGYALSGVVLSLGSDFFERHRDRLLFACALALPLAAAGGYILVTRNPFNPLEFQNAVLWKDQLGHIGMYYAALFPFFFASGIFIGLSFLTGRREIPRLYMVDLVGAGAGALLMLGALFLVHPFALLGLLLALLVPPVLLTAPRSLPRRVALGGALLLALGCGFGASVGARPALCPYKALASALNVENSRVEREIRTPEGLYQLVSSYGERMDADLSNNYELLGAGGPPDAVGVYRDGDRISALPRSGSFDLSYLRAGLDSLPYVLRPGARTLLLGSRGTFRFSETRALGATSVTALETDPVLQNLGAEYLHSLEASGGLSSDVATLLALPPYALTPDRGSFDVVDVSLEFLDQGAANKYVLTEDGIAHLLTLLSPRGVLSIPVSISEFTVYAVKAVATARAALERAGVSHPERHLLVYRSSWNARILVSPTPWTPEDGDLFRAFCSARSFDTAYFSGMDPATGEVWNDLPPVSFEDEAVRGGEGPQDALRDDLVAFLDGGDRSSSSWTFFDLSPATFDRPFFSGILRPKNLPAVLSRMDILPRPEIAMLINGAVLLQALLFALVVLALPLLRRRRMELSGGQILRGMGYFACLGLGFLAVEMALIERATFYLGDPSWAFALVLASMLIFSGLGSLLAEKLFANSRRGAPLAAAGACALVALLALGLMPLFSSTLSWSPWAKRLLVVLVAALPSLALGMPFPQGLSWFGGRSAAFLPWAWGINGAFSVIATPLASLTAVLAGYRWVFIGAAALYALGALVFPRENGDTDQH